MSTRTISASDREAAANVWRAIERVNGSGGVACSWVWTNAWLEHYGDVVPHRFVVGVLDGRDVGVVLVTEAPERFPPVVGVREAHIGTAGEPRGEGVFVERNRLLVAAARRDAFAAALLRHVDRDPRWDRLVIPGLQPEDAESFRRASPRVVFEAHESPIADLALANGGDPLQLLASRPRRRARRALDGLAPLRVEWAQTPEQAHEIMDELIELHQERWTASGEPGAFASARFVGFHRALIDRLEMGRDVMLVRVSGPDGTLGCLYGPVEDGEVLFYQSGLRRLADNKLNVGLAVHVSAMRACVEHGMLAYDFLAPSMRYKEELSTRSGSLVWASVERARPRTHLNRAVRRVRAWQAERRTQADAARSTGGRPPPVPAP